MRRLAAAWCALAGAGVGGCTRLMPVPAGAQAAVPAGAQVRVTLTAAGAVTVAPRLGTAVTGVEGSWVSGGADTIVVRVDRLQTGGGLVLGWRGEPVALPREAVQQVERSRIARGRTALVVIGGVALGAAIVGAVRGGSRGGPGDGGVTPF